MLVFFDKYFDDKNHLHLRRAHKKTSHAAEPMEPMQG